MRQRGYLIIGAAALALAACGSKGADGNAATAAAGGDDGAATASTAANIDPCSLITVQEVAAITGDAVTKAVRQDETCSYRGETRGEDGVEVLFDFNDGERQMRGFRGAAGLLDGMSGEVATKGAAGADAAAMMKKDTAAAPKIGDEAAWGMNTALGVRKGANFFQVIPPVMRDPGRKPGLPLLNTEEKRAIVQQVAAKVAERLPS